MEQKPDTIDTAGLKTQIAALENQIKHSHDVLKWGMGLFGGFAVLLVGYNWWNGKTNYDRDKASFEKTLSLAQQEMATQNEKQLTSMRVQNESNALRLAALQDTVLSNALNNINCQADTNIEKLVNARKAQIDSVVSNFTFFTHAVSNAVDRVEDRLKDHTRLINSVITNLVHTNETLASNLVAAFDTSFDGANAISTAVQGNQLCMGNKMRSIHDKSKMQIGIFNLTISAELFLKKEDEHNLRIVLGYLDQYLPTFLTKLIHAPRGVASTLDGANHLGDEMDRLIERLRSETNHGRYFLDAAKLESQNRLYKKVVKDDVETKIR